jgi:hypothetical protein
LITARTLILLLGLVILAIASLYVSLRNPGSFLLYALSAAALLLIIIIVQRIRLDASKQKKSEQKFKALPDAAPDATIIVTDKGIVETEKFFSLNIDHLLNQPSTHRSLCQKH